MLNKWVADDRWFAVGWASRFKRILAFGQSVRIGELRFDKLRFGELRFDKL